VTAPEPRAKKREIKWGYRPELVAIRNRLYFNGVFAILNLHSLFDFFINFSTFFKEGFGFALPRGL